MFLDVRACLFSTATSLVSLLLHDPSFAPWTKCQQPQQPCASSHPSLNTHLCQSNPLELLCQTDEVACKQQPVPISLLLLNYLHVKYPVCNNQSWTQGLMITWYSLILDPLPAEVLLCGIARPYLSLFLCGHSTPQPWCKVLFNYYPQIPGKLLKNHSWLQALQSALLNTTISNKKMSTGSSQAVMEKDLSKSCQCSHLPLLSTMDFYYRLQTCSALKTAPLMSRCLQHIKQVRVHKREAQHGSGVLHILAAVFYFLRCWNCQ